MTSTSDEKTLVGDPAAATAGDEGLNPTTQKSVEEVTIMFPQSADKILAADIVTAMCPLRTCDETFTGTPEDASEWHYQHSHKHKAMADTLKIDYLDVVGIEDESLAEQGGGGVTIALELHTDHGMFGEPTTSKHYVSLDKYRGANNGPGIPAYMLPQLIDQLQRLHGEYTRQLEAGE